MGKQRLVNLYEERPIGVNPASYTQTGTQSQYDVGLLPGMDINQYRADQQTGWDKLGNGLFNMGTSAFTGALESTVGLGVGISSAFADGKASSFYNNAFGEWIDSLNESARELAPFYQTEEEKAMGLGESMGTANFWFDKVLGGTGYTLGSLAAGYGLNSLFKLSTRAAAGMITSADDAMAILQSAEKAAKGIDRLDLTKQFAVGMVMAHGESAMEARQTYDESMQQLTQARDQGREGNPEFAQYANLSDEQIQKYSEDASNSNYLMNLAITGPTDMMLLGKWINPGTKEAIEQYTKVADRIGSQVVNGTTSYFDRLAKQKGRAFLKGSEAFLKGFGTESFQEGSQFASNVAAQEFVKNFQINDEGRLSSIISGLGEGLKKTATTREGQESMLVGGLTGGPFGLKGFKSQMESEDLAAKQLVENLNSDVNFVDQGKSFGKIFGKTDTTVQSVTDKIKSINKDLSIAERAKLENDLFTANNAEENALSQYIKMHIDKGTDEFLKDKLEMLKKASPEEMAEFFGVTDKTNPDKYAERIDKIISNIDQYKKLNNTLHRVYGITSGTKEEKMQNRNLRDRLFYASVNIDNIQKRIDSISKGLKETTIDSGMKGLSLMNLRDMAINSVTNTSLDEINKQAKELGLDYIKYLKQYKDNAFKEYNDTLKKLLEDDPLKATEVIDMLADLNKLHERKQHFVDYYNALNDPKKAKELLLTEEKLQKDNEKKVNAAIEFQKAHDEAIGGLDANEIFAVDPNRSNNKVVGGNEIDLGKLTTEELVNLKLSLEKDLKDIDKEVREGNKTKEVLDKEAELQNELSTVIDELKFKGNEQKIVNSYIDRLNKAKNIEEIIAIVQEAQDKGIMVNQEKINQLIQDLNKLAEDFSKKLKNEEEPFVMNMNFKGVQEFSSMIFLNEDARKAFEQLKNQGDFLDKIEFIIEDNKDKNPDDLRPIGYGDKQHPRLKKRIPPFTIKVVHKDTKETVLGFLPYYDQYWDMKNNKAIVFEALGEQEFRDIFSPGKNYPDYTLEQMKMARLANKAIYDKVQALKKERINNSEVKAILDMQLTRGSFNTVNPLDDLTPLDKLPIHKINGVPVIVDIAIINGTASITPLMGLSTYDATKDKIVFPEVYDKAQLKLKEIARNNVSNPLNSKYWALVEDKVGQVEHEGKKYTWIPITSNQLSTEKKKLVFDTLKALRTKLISNGFKTEDEYKAELTALNNMFFISMHDTSGYTTHQKTFLVVSKGSDKVPVGNVALKIEYKINGQKGEAWFNFDIDKVNSFDDIINEVERLRVESKGKSRQDLAGLQPITIRSIRENLGKFDLINPNERDIMSEFGGMVKENYLINQNLLFNGKIYNAPPASKPPVKDDDDDDVDPADIVNKKDMLPVINPKDANDEPSGLPLQNSSNTLVIPSANTGRKVKVDPNLKSNNTGFSRVNINEINYVLKAINILQSDKAKDIFNKGQKANWDLNKILTELAIPKEQKQLILDLGKTNREDIITDLLTNYSYTVKINTTKEPIPSANIAYDTFVLNGDNYSKIDTYRKNGEKISKEEYGLATEAYKKTENLGERNTGYYSNMIVPGGTNYTENEIAIPAIIPAIKGHAQFATDNGIGWFRSDDYVKPTHEFDEFGNEYSVETEPTKTRRILEVQSDLFQKGRDKADLININLIGNKNFISNGYRYKKSYSGPIGNEKYFKEDIEITKEEFNEAKKYIDSNSKDNQFLQLLNKDNAWVTFFVKSIIQDSAKKGYEKVLFPSGNTASKVEGHTTLEEFKKQKENRIKDLEKNLAYREKTNIYDDPNDNIAHIQQLKNEIAQLKQELERIEGPEGFGALRPIFNFYETTVANVLKKQGYTSKLITDEYGNTWNEIEITPNTNNTIVLNRGNISLAVPVSYTQAMEDIKGLIPSFINIEQLDAVMQNINDGRITFGSFSNYTIRLANGIPNGTQFHEVFHSVFRTMLSNEQQDIVYAEARDLLRKSLGSKSFNQAFREFKAEHDEYAHIKSDKELEAIFIEEFLADQFKDWMTNKEKSLVFKEAKSKGLFKSIIDFFKNILNFAKWFDGNTDLLSLFSSIETGKFKNAEVIRNRFTGNKNVLYSQIFAGKFEVDGEQIDDYLDANVQERLINTIVSKILTKDTSLSENDVINNTIEELSNLFDVSSSQYDDLFDGDNVKENYQREYHEIRKLYNALNITESINQLKAEVNKTLKLYVDLNDDSDEGYDGENNITERSFDLNQENVGGFGSLSTMVKRYIGITTYESSLSEFFGFTPTDNPLSKISIVSAVNPKKVYDTLVKGCANQQRPSQVLSKMNAIKNELHEGKHFLNKFFEETGLKFDSDGNLESYNRDKYALIQRVAKAFNLEYKNYVFTQVDNATKQFNTFNANQQDVHTKQVTVWKGNFIANKARYGKEFDNILVELEGLNNEIGKYNGALPEEALNKYVDKYQIALQKTGISLSRGYLKYLLLTTNIIKNKSQSVYVSQFQDLVDILGKTDGKFFIESLEQVIKSIREGTNPFERSIGLENEELGNLGRLLRIAKDNATFDENVYIVTLRNAEGKTIYPYQTSNYNSLALPRILSGDLSEGMEQPNVDYLENNFLDNNMEFALLNTNNKITVDRIEGIKQASLQYDKTNDAVKSTKSGDGVTYGSMTDRELALKKLALFADSSTDFKERDSKGNIKRIVPARRIIFTIMEASNTADTILVPLHEVTTSKGTISNVFKDFIFNEIEREYKRIQNVTEGKYKAKYKDFNTGSKRGLRFWENNNVFIGDRGNDIKKQLESLEITPEDVKKELYEMIEKSFLNEFNDYVNKLIDLKIIDRNTKGEIINVLLDPRYFGENGINGTNPFKDVSDKNVLTNLLYTYLNTYMNSTSFNQMLQGDPALSLKDFMDWSKRAKGSNAAGANMLSFDEKLNDPIAVVTYAEIEGDKFSEPSYDRYAVASLDGKSDKMIARYDNEGNITSEWSKFLEEHRTLRLANGFSEKDIADEIKEFEKQGSIDYNDAQCESTVEGFLHFKKLLGEMTTIGEKIYNKIKNGTFGKQSVADQVRDWEYLKENDLMANSIKLVYYDGTTYIKMSVALLAPEFTTRPDGKPKRGKELLHRKRIEMEKNGIKLMGPPSMMKKMLKNPTQIKDGNLNIQEENIQFIDPLHLKLQQMNPSNKREIKDPSQVMQLIASEQKRDIEVFLPDGTKSNVGNVLDDYNRLLSERVGLSYQLAKEFLYPLQNDNPTLNKSRLIKMFKETLEISGASQQLLDLLRTDDQGNPIHNFNLEHIVTQFEQQYNAYFNKVFVQKVPGYKTTLQSGYGYNIVFEKSTGRVVPSYEYDANPKKFDSDDYGTRPLAFDQPRIINGNEVHRYSEIVLPYHFAEMFNLQPGDEIPDAIAYMFGVRIPSQDKHSAMVLRVVDVMPPYYGSNCIFPHELIKLTGSDFDIDSFYIHRMAHYVDANGKFKEYGNTEDSRWEQFLTYQHTNNKFFRKILREVEKHPDYKSLERFEQVKIALKELGLPISEKEFISSNTRILGEINNEILMNKMILHTNKGINDLINKMPVSLKIMEDYLTNIAKALGYDNWRDIDKSYSPNSMLGMLSAFEINKAGQKAIGAAVNNTQVYTVLSQFGIQASYSEGKSPVFFDMGDKVIMVGDIVKGLTLTDDQRRIADVLTTLTSSMTDNPKYGYNSKMNIDINSLSTLSFLVSTHIPFETAATLLQNEYVREYIKRSKSFAIKTQSEIESSSPQVIMEKLLQELKAEIKRIDPFYSDEALRELAKTPITLTELHTNVHEFSPMRKEYRDASDTLKERLDNKKDLKYYESQYKILSGYSQLSQQAAIFTTFSQVIKLTKGVASSDNQTSFKGDDEIVDNLAKLNLKLVKIGDNYDLAYIDSKVDMMYDFKDIIKNHPITWKNLTIFADKQELAKPTFITKTDFAKDIINAAVASKKVNLNKKQRNKFSSELRRTLNAFLMLKALRHSESKNPDSKLFKYNSNALLYKDVAEANGISTLDEDQLRIKTEFSEFQNNIWIQQVNFIKDGNNIKASYNTMNKGSVGFERMIIADFNKLFRDPRTKDFAIKAFEYLISHSALRFRNNSFVSILPEYMFIKLSKNITDFHNTLNNPNDLGFKAYFNKSVNELKEEFLNDFFRDIHNQEFVIPLKPKGGRAITSEEIQERNKKGNDVIKIENNKLIIDPVANNKGLNLFHPDVENQKQMESLKKDNLAVGFGTLQSMFNIKKIILKNGESGTLFNFPKFISVGSNLYRLNFYKEDFSKNELTNSDENGNYWGLSADYTLVSKFGDKILGAVPYGRTIEQNEEVNSSVLSQKYKDSQENVADNEEEEDDDIDPSMLPNSNINNALATESTPLPILDNSKLIPLTSNFTRESVKNDPGYIYLFTDNAKRTSGNNSIEASSWYRQKYTGTYPLSYPSMTQAVARGLNNAFPITTMVDDNRTQWKDSQFEEYKKIIDDEINTIKEAQAKFKGIKFGAQMPFGQGKISNMKESAPKIWNYMNQKLAEIGIDNTGNKPTIIESKPIDAKPVSVSKKDNEDITNLPPKTAKNTINILGTSGGNDVTNLKSNGYQFFNLLEKTQDSFGTQDILNSVKKALSLAANTPFEMVKEAYTKITDVEKVKEINKIFCK